LILGVDHGKVVTSVGGKMHYRDYGGAGTVHGKDTPEVLEKSIMPWLTHDLEIIHRSKLVIAKRSGDDKLVCAFVDDLAEVDFAEGTHIVHHVEIYNTGDLKLMAMLLGMADMSNEWCIFCFWCSGQWRFDTHQLGEEQTIEKQISLAEDGTKKGADRLGVKGLPYWPFIPICNYTIPLLHILIGVFNDIDDYLMELVDSTIIAVAAREMALRVDLAGIDDIVNTLQTAVKEFDKSADGKERSKLIRRKNRQDSKVRNGLPLTDYLSVDDISRYQNLQNIRADKVKERESKKAKKKKHKGKVGRLPKGTKAG
jgi:hypothetical protein